MRYPINRLQLFTAPVFLHSVRVACAFYTTNAQFIRRTLLVTYDRAIGQLIYYMSFRIYWRTFARAPPHQNALRV